MRKENANTSTGSVDPDTDRGESFLGRWSRRKQLARTEPDQTASAGRQTAPAPSSVPAEEDKPPERVLRDEDMPPLESLDADSDYKGFLSPGVSETLRNAALRKLFLSSKFNVVDGLDDYADDFTKFQPLGDIITADMRHQMELAEERAKKALEDEMAESADASAESADERNEETVESSDGHVPTASAQSGTGADQMDEEASGDPSQGETSSG